MKRKILILTAIIGFGIFNSITLFNNLPNDFSRLSLQQITAFASGEGSSGDSGGACPQRGGSELPSKVLRNTDCTKTIKVQVRTSVTYEKVQGSQCKCKSKPSGYQGIMGCNLTWETACK